jgi:hypothetical protein
MYVAWKIHVSKEHTPNDTGIARMSHYGLSGTEDQPKGTLNNTTNHTYIFFLLNYNLQTMILFPCHQFTLKDKFHYSTQSLDWCCDNITYKYISSLV